MARKSGNIILAPGLFHALLIQFPPPPFAARSPPYRLLLKRCSKLALATVGPTKGFPERAPLLFELSAKFSTSFGNFNSSPAKILSPFRSPAQLMLEFASLTA